MNVIGPNDPSVDVKGPLGFGLPDGSAQSVNLTNEQVAIPDRQIDGEKHWNAGKPWSSVVGQTQRISSFWLMVREITHPTVERRRRVRARTHHPANLGHARNTHSKISNPPVAPPNRALPGLTNNIAYGRCNLRHPECGAPKIAFAKCRALAASHGYGEAALLVNHARTAI